MDITSLAEPKPSKSFPSTNSLQYYDAQLALAFQSDCENLLHKFKDSHSYNFRAFSQVWKELSFIEVFKGVDNILMLQAFIENCFFIVKKFFSLEDLHMQTGAIYLLYALFYKQPIKQWVKIRLTQSDVDTLEQIVQELNLMCLDPIFIYNKMRLDGAFHYCVFPCPLGLELRHMKRYDLTSEEIRLNKAENNVIDRFKKLVEEDHDLMQFEETDEEYRRLAQKYKQQLFVFPSKIGDALKNVHSEMFQVELEDKESENQFKITKSKAASNMTALYRGEKKVVTALDLQKPSTSKRI